MIRGGEGHIMCWLHKYVSFKLNDIMNVSNLRKTALVRDYPLHSKEDGLRRRYYFEVYSRSNTRTTAYYNSKQEAEDDLPNFAYYIYSCCRRRWQNLSNRHKMSFIYEESFITSRIYIINMQSSLSASCLLL